MKFFKMSRMIQFPQKYFVDQKSFSNIMFKSIFYVPSAVMSFQRKYIIENLTIEFHFLKIGQGKL